MSLETLFGADEAGRGPVLGSLFIGFVDAPTESLPDGLADSKELTRADIDELAVRLQDMDAVASTVIEIPASKIDESGASITALTARAMGEAIATTAESDRGVVDACHTDPDVFEEMVTDAVDGVCDRRVDAQHGADTEIEQVMAASILAKHAREQHVDALRETYGDVGSGYPSDPSTKAFLKSHIAEHGELPSCARETWQTSQDALATAEQTSFAAFE